MLDLLGIAEALKGVGANIEGVAVAALGVNQSFPQTPALEVILADGTLQTLAAGGPSQLQNVRVQVVFYVAMTANLETDERDIVPLVEGFINAVTAGDFDYTLGGRVEDVRPVRFSFDILNRNGRFYRYAAVELVAGDLDGDL